MLHRFPKGLAGDKVHQKRLPAGAPEWIETVQLFFPRWKRTADELCVTELAASSGRCRCRPSSSTRGTAAGPTPSSRTSGGSTSTPVRSATGRPSSASRTSRTRCSTSSAPSASPRPVGGSGMHVYVRIPPDHGFQDVRRGALAFAREVERRAAGEVTTAWWRKDRDPSQLFVDYNQNARDHTIAAAYSVRGVPERPGVRTDPVGRGRRLRTGRLHDRHDARAVRRDRRPARRHRRAPLRHRAAARVGRPRRGRGGSGTARARGSRTASSYRSGAVPDAGRAPTP